MQPLAGNAQREQMAVAFAVGRMRPRGRKLSLAGSRAAKVGNDGRYAILYLGGDKKTEGDTVAVCTVYREVVRAACWARSSLV